MNSSRQHFRLYMLEALTKAAEHFKVKLKGRPTYGWRDRTIGSQVIGDQGKCWLRVALENKWWTQGDWWKGNVAADAIQGIAKPRMIDTYEWSDGDLCLRAELMTFAEGRVCSSTPELRSLLELPDYWWKELRTSINRLSSFPTKRICIDQSKVTRRFLVFYGDEIDATVNHWTTAHGDLHWANLMNPKLTILDWEGWGLAPAGYDAATLYCHSLLVPEMAAQVHQTFRDILDTRDGALAQLLVITRMLRRIDQGDYIDLAGPLHRLARKLRVRLL